CRNWNLSPLPPQPEVSTNCSPLTMIESPFRVASVSLALAAERILFGAEVSMEPGLPCTFQHPGAREGMSNVSLSGGCRSGKVTLTSSSSPAERRKTERGAVLVLKKPFPVTETLLSWDRDTLNRGSDLDISYSVDEQRTLDFLAVRIGRLFGDDES